MTQYGDNVAAVPKYSPFRYPGGKTWLYSAISRWLRSVRAETLIEPFAGGATASLIGVIEGYVERAILVEKDEAICAVWHTILSPDIGWLVERISRFEPTREAIISNLSKNPRRRRELAFQTILKNRCRRGGVIAGGAGLLLNGERSKGIISRWYPETLITRMTLIHALRDRIELRTGDGLEELVLLSSRKDKIAIFADPPYPKLMEPRVKKLYDHYVIEHSRLFEILGESRRNFLLTYDESPLVCSLVAHHSFQAAKIVMQNSNTNAKTELLITPKLK
jgi:DNA adenine methylase